jgi:signal recognition particle subunit SRP54
MGDVLSLIERVQQNVTEEETKTLEKRMRAGQLDFEDFLKQLNMVRKMMSGQGLAGLIGMIPGMRQMMRQIGDMNVDESHFKYIEAMIQSMTVEERRNPKLIDGSRRKRIARGSGRTVQEVNELLKAREEMQKMVKQMGLMTGGGKKGKKLRVPKGLMGL